MKVNVNFTLNVPNDWYKGYMTDKEVRNFIKDQMEWTYGDSVLLDLHNEIDYIKEEKGEVDK